MKLCCVLLPLLTFNLTLQAQEFEAIFGPDPMDHDVIGRFLHQHDNRLQNVVDEIRDSAQLYPYVVDSTLKLRYRELDSTATLYYHGYEDCSSIFVHQGERVVLLVTRSDCSLIVLDSVFWNCAATFTLNRKGDIKRWKYNTHKSVQVEYRMKRGKLKKSVKQESIPEPATGRVEEMFEMFWWE